MKDTETLIAVAVVEWHGQFLVGQRSSGVPLAGLWEFPGGKVEPGESAEQAAVRECREETGLDVQVMDEYPEQAHQYEHGRVRLRFFRCQPLQSEASPLPPFVWIPRQALSELPFPEGNKALLQLLSQQRS